MKLSSDKYLQIKNNYDIIGKQCDKPVPHHRFVPKKCFN